MFARTIILPVKDNKGVSLLNERRAVEGQLLTLAGGYTRDKVTGAWLDNGKVYRDQSYRYTLAVDAAQDAAIVAQLPVWCESLRQLALYTTRQEVDVSFIEPATTQVAS
jgi:hypothetical protein